MRIAIIGQEEPVYFGPFLRSIINARPDEVVLVVIAGNRGSGIHPRTLKERLESVYILWIIMEPLGFLRNLFINLWQGLIKSLGPVGLIIDKRSLMEAARRLNIPVLKSKDLNSGEFITELRKYSPDVIINQAEILLKDDILSVPKIGTINRHASLLPHFRGRVASWWSHAAEPPEYGVTIHFVGKEIDSGPIILQKKIDIDPRAPYSRVLDLLFSVAPGLMLEALEKVQTAGFTPVPNQYKGTRLYLFPTLKEVKAYRAVLKQRRKAI